MDPRLIVEVRFGPMQGRKAVIEKGGLLTVGRTEIADFAVTHDPQMSGKHFRLSWDGRACLLDDLGSVKGTRVAGELVSHAELEHGSWIRAGGTDFLVYVEGKVPPSDEEEAESRGDIDPALVAWRRRKREARAAAAEQALSTLREEAAKERLFAVLDAARTPRILELLRQNVEPHRSLFEGVEGDTLAEVAPYLVGPMKPESLLLEALVREGFGAKWGVFFACAEQSFDDVRRHLRRFVFVVSEDTGEKFYFRFYDPSVMKAFLGSSPVRHLADFWQIFTAIFVDEESGARRLSATEAAC